MSRKFGWHSGTMTCQDAKIKGDLYVQDDIVFSDVSAGVLGVTGGIEFADTSVFVNNVAIQIGTNSSPITYTPTATGIHSGIQMYITSDDCISGLSMAAIRAKVTFTGTTNATAYGGNFWVKIDTQDGSGFTGDYQGGHPDAVIGVLEIPTSAIVTSSSIYATMTGVTGEVRPILGTVSQTGTICAVRALVQSVSDNISIGTLAGLMVQTTAAGTVDVGVLIQPHIGSTITKGIYIDPIYGTITTGIDIGTATTGIAFTGTNTACILVSGTATYFADFDDATTCAITTESGAATSIKGNILVKTVAGATGYINVYGTTGS